VILFDVYFYCVVIVFILPPAFFRVILDSNVKEF